jgi:hypothetical protein
MRSIALGIIGLSTLGALFTAAAHADGAAVLVKPETLVDHAGHAVVNGCGSDLFRLTSIDRRLANLHTYKFEVAYGEYATYTVTFVESCNLHDAGYQGRFWVRLTDGSWVISLVAASQTGTMGHDARGNTTRPLSLDPGKDIIQEVTTYFSAGSDCLSCANSECKASVTVR